MLRPERTPGQPRDLPDAELPWARAACNVDRRYSTCPQWYHRVDGWKPVSARDGYGLLHSRGWLPAQSDPGGGEFRRAEWLSDAIYGAPPSGRAHLRGLPHSSGRFAELGVGSRKRL